MTDAPRYTNEELKMLFEKDTALLTEYALQKCFEQANYSESFLKCILHKTGNAYKMLFETPLEEVPLHINSLDNFLRKAAAWRLKLGK